MILFFAFISLGLAQDSCDISGFSHVTVRAGTTGKAIIGTGSFYDAPREGGPHTDYIVSGIDDSDVGQGPIDNIEVSPNSFIATSLGPINLSFDIPEIVTQEGSPYKDLKIKITGDSASGITCEDTLNVCIKPKKGQNNTLYAWSDVYDGAGFTTAQWTMELEPSIADFTGRRVRENHYTSTSIDLCHSNAIATMPAGTVPAFVFGLTGGEWSVAGGNSIDFDYVGYGSDLVDYYRTMPGFVSCEAFSDQPMEIDCDGNWKRYDNDRMKVTIDTTSVCVTKNGSGGPQCTPY